MLRFTNIAILILAVLFAFSCDETRKSNPVILMVSVESDTPPEQQVLSGSLNTLFSHFKFEAGKDKDIQIQMLRFFNSTAGSDAAINTVHLYSQTTLLGSSTLTNGYALFNALNIAIPKNGSVVLRVRCDLNNSSTVANISGMAPRFVIENVQTDVTASTAGKTLIDREIIGDNDTVAVGLTSHGNNVVTNAQHVTDSMLNIVVGNNCPMGSQGSAWGFGTEVTLFEFEVIPFANSTVANPQEVLIEEITATLHGGAEASNLSLYWSLDGYTNPIATSPYTHITTKFGGDPRIVSDHQTTTGKATFPVGLSVGHGIRVTFRVMGYVYAITDNNSPLRGLRVFIENLGTANTIGDIVYRDNGAGSHQWNWIYIPGRLEIRPTNPMAWSGANFIP